MQLNFCTLPPQLQQKKTVQFSWKSMLFNKGVLIYIISVILYTPVTSQVRGMQNVVQKGKAVSKPQQDYIHTLLLLCQHVKACSMMQGELLSNSETCLVLQADINSSTAAVTFAGSPITPSNRTMNMLTLPCLTTPHSSSMNQLTPVV